MRADYRRLGRQSSAVGCRHVASPRATRVELLLSAARRLEPITDLWRSRRWRQPTSCLSWRHSAPIAWPWRLRRSAVSPRTSASADVAWTSGTCHPWWPPLVVTCPFQSASQLRRVVSLHIDVGDRARSHAMSLDEVGQLRRVVAQPGVSRALSAAPSPVTWSRPGGSASRVAGDSLRRADSAPLLWLRRTRAGAWPSARPW